MTKRNNKNTSGANIVLITIAVFAAIMIAAYCCIAAWQKTWNFTKWTLKPAEKQEQTEPEKKPADSGFIAPSETESNGIKFISAAIPAAQYAASGISPAAETAITLTVTSTPADADLTGGKFTYKFKNAASEWASGKTLSEYVTLSETDSSHANISCLKPFGEQIIVTYTVTGENGENVTADYPLDYAKRITSVGLPQIYVRSGSSHYSRASGTSFLYNELNAADNYFGFSEFGIVYSDYTVDDEFTVADDAQFGLTESFSAACKQASITPSHEKNGGSMTLEKIYLSEGSTNALTYFFGETAYKTAAFRNVVTAQNDGGVFELKLHLQGTHSEYTETFTWGLDISGFPKAAQSVQFQDSGHIF